MPKENINDVASTGSRIEVSWRAEERVCPCGAIWTVPVSTCPQCCRENVPITSGHVQVASVNQRSPFEFPAEPDGEKERFDGWRVTLDGRSIDRIAEALTKARRQAFPIPGADDLLYEAWGLIANAGWDAHRARVDLDKSPGWHDAAVRWRAQYHEHLARQQMERAA